MTRQAFLIAAKCFVDLGVAIAYAAFVGLLIVAIVASDDGFASIGRTLAYASLLPLAAAALVGAEAVVRIMETRSSGRRRAAKSGLLRS